MKNKKRKLSNVVICIGVIFIAASLSLAAYNAYAELNAAKTVESVLEILRTEIPNYNVEEVINNRKQTDTYYTTDENEQLPLYVLNPEIEMPEITVNTLDYIGILYLPSINKELPIIGEWSYDNLKSSPCCYSGSAYNGNFVICAHNYSEHFGGIEYLSEGDEIIFTDVEGNNFYYTVEFIDVLQPTDVEDMISEDFDLTLFTCNFTGQARVTVRCRRE